MPRIILTLFTRLEDYKRVSLHLVAYERTDSVPWLDGELDLNIWQRGPEGEALSEQALHWPLEKKFVLVPIDE